MVFFVDRNKWPVFVDRPKKVNTQKKKNPSKNLTARVLMTVFYDLF